MDSLTTIGWVLLAVSVTLRWWRIVVPLATATLVSWLIDMHTPIHSVWLSYALVVASLGAGVGWQLSSRRLHRGAASQLQAAGGRE